MKKQDKEQEKTIEESLQELEGILSTLENEDISLEESFHYYESGMKLVKECSGRIDKVEKQIQILSETYGEDEEQA